MEVLSSFLLRCIKSQGPCCVLFSIGWHAWTVENKCKHKSVLCGTKAEHNFLGIYEHLGRTERLGASWDCSLQHLVGRARTVLVQLIALLACVYVSIVQVRPDLQVEEDEASRVMLKASIIFLANPCTLCMADGLWSGHLSGDFRCCCSGQAVWCPEIQNKRIDSLFFTWWKFLWSLTARKTSKRWSMLREGQWCCEGSWA